MTSSKKRSFITRTSAYTQWLRDMLPLKTYTVIETKEEITLTASREHFVKLVHFLRDHSNCQFKILVDIVGVDYPEKLNRFEVSYHFLSVRFSRRLSIKVACNATEGLPTLTSLFFSASWFEREVWDMFGISFLKHPDLRRLLTDYGFVGHPLRKDYPLTGFVDVRYDGDRKRVVCESLQLAQEFRSFAVEKF